MKNNTMPTPVGASGINLNPSSFFFSALQIGLLSAAHTLLLLLLGTVETQKKKRAALPPPESHEAHVALRLPPLLRLEPETQKQTGSL